MLAKEEFEQKIEEILAIEPTIGMTEQDLIKFKTREIMRMMCSDNCRIRLLG